MSDSLMSAESEDHFYIDYLSDEEEADDDANELEVMDISAGAT